MTDATLRGLHRMTLQQRISALQNNGFLSAADAELIRQGRHVLLPQAADRMIENVIGVFALPLAVAPNFIVNGDEILVPMVVEEPSIVAGVSSAAKLARPTGGFDATAKDNCLIGQIHVTGISDMAKSVAALEADSDRLTKLANEVHPRMLSRGGGVRELRFRQLRLANAQPLLAVHLLVDTVDAMGANLVNSLCEAIAPEIGRICGGDIALRILSNLADTALVTARVKYRPADLASSQFDGEIVCRRIIMASDIAVADRYRAATHNKGIMNGIDAVALATGNDWRAIEAGAHAYAARDGYAPLAVWRLSEDGCLLGEIELPLKVGTVGGTLANNRAAATCLGLTGARSATALAELMAAVGLAQNFAALKALATYGIQRGHMHLHARSLVAATGLAEAAQSDVLRKLVASGDISASNARSLAAQHSQRESATAAPRFFAAGKIILLGEHAAVYGSHALAVPLPDALGVSVSPTTDSATVRFSNDAGGISLTDDAVAGVRRATELILQQLDAARRMFDIDVFTRLPPAMGLGSSAALAVALIRALAAELGRSLTDDDVNRLAFECEKLAHGTPSGIDNTLATYATPILYRGGSDGEFKPVELRTPLPLLIGFSHSPGLTRDQVAGVHHRRDQQPEFFDSVFEQINRMSLAAATALEKADLETLGSLMNLCQGLLNGIGVSTAELEAMLSIARSAGASGAKLTGGGGGGSIVALGEDPEQLEVIAGALQDAGFATLIP